MIASIRNIAGLLMLFTLTACATSSGVLVNGAAPKVAYTSAYVIVHGDQSNDMDAVVQKELLRHGINVSVGPGGGAPQDVQLLVRYSDDWKWDLKMYLRSFDLMIFEAKTNVLLATGSWKNSTFHGFYDEEKVVRNVVTETLEKLATH